MEDIAVLMSSIEVTASSMFEDAEPISSLPASTFSDGAPGEFVSRTRRFAHLRGEAADLLGHNGEAASGIACARGFDGGVQREDVRLERDVFDGVGQLRDALGVVLISSMAHTVRA